MSALFVGLTRPSMKYGVTMDALIGNAVGTLIVFIVSGALTTLLLFPVLHGVCWLLCLRDVRIFRLLSLKGVFLGRSRLTPLWGGSTGSPLSNTRKAYAGLL